MRSALSIALALTAAIAAPRALHAEPAAITPHETIVLFNGRDLSGFYTWLGKTGREDPEGVFSVVDQIDGAPALRMSGKYFGGLVTQASYANYRLVAEYRWGLLTWASRKDKARDAGILLHCQGEDGNNAKNFHGAWLRSVEFQILEGGTGDIWLVPGYERDRPEQIQPHLTVVVKKHKLGFPQWNPEEGVVTELKNFGRIGWRGLDPDWQPALNFRGRADVEKPLGQWNHIEAVCDGGDLTYFLNGVKVNEGRNGSLKEGRLLFQSEGAEIFFRRIELHPLHP